MNGNSHSPVHERVVPVTRIGIVHSPNHTCGAPPIQSAFSPACGEIEIYPEYRPGLKDVDGFSRLIVLYYFDRAQGPMLHERPLMDGSEVHGIFSTRHFNRPSPIGLSFVTLKEVTETSLIVGNVDMLDGTPVLDIKPYIPAFDSFPDERTGWVRPQHIDALRAGSARAGTVPPGTPEDR